MSLQGLPLSLSLCMKGHSVTMYSVHAVSVKGSISLYFIILVNELFQVKSNDHQKNIICHKNNRLNP